MTSSLANTERHINRTVQQYTPLVVRQSVDDNGREREKEIAVVITIVERDDDTR